jgi:hypothetical protein
MTDFSNHAEVRRWLEAQPREVAVALATRAALRVLPLLGTRRPGATLTSNRDIILLCFRAAAVAWVEANHGMEIGAVEAANSAAYAAHSADMTPSDAAVANIIGDAAHATSADRPAAAAADAIFANRFSAAPFAAARSVARDEALEFEKADSLDQRRRVAVEVTRRPLWPEKTPRVFLNAWGRLKAQLLSVDEDWNVWTDWYEHRLAGRASAERRLDLTYVSSPDEIWHQGPKVVNAEIRQLIESERASHRLPSEASLPAQTARSAAFVRHNSGVIDVGPPSLKDKLADAEDVQEFYLEVQEKTAELASLGSNMLGARLAKAVATFQARMPAKIQEAIERRVWSTGNTLRVVLEAHDKVSNDRDPHPDRLDPGAAERLRDVVETFNQLALADPALRQRDESRLGPREYSKVMAEVGAAVGIVAAAAEDRAITTEAAGSELHDQVSVAEQPGRGLPGRLATEAAQGTFRNFFAGTMIAAYRASRSLLASARGEGGFVSKELFSGVYKAAGAALFGTAAYYLRWEILDFILTNTTALKAYAALAFEHSPGFAQMIDWLEAHIEHDEMHQSPASGRPRR